MITESCPVCSATVMRADNDVVLDTEPSTEHDAIWGLMRLGSSVLAASHDGLGPAYRMHEHQVIPPKPGKEGFMTLGGLIELLVPQPSDGLVSFDFSGLTPGRFHSWRMDYSQLCLDTRGQWPVKTGELLAQARKAVGSTFQGWKGGDYTMHEGTSIIIAQAGDPGGCYAHGFTTITGTANDDDDTVLLTAEVKLP